MLVLNADLREIAKKNPIDVLYEDGWSDDEILIVTGVSDDHPFYTNCVLAKSILRLYINKDNCLVINVLNKALSHKFFEHPQSDEILKMMTPQKYQP